MFHKKSIRNLRSAWPAFFAKQAVTQRTTGWIRIPRQPNTNLHLYASNLGQRPIRLQVRLNELVEGRRKRSRQDQELRVPAQGVGHLSIPAPQGDTVEWVVNGPAASVVLSSVDLQFFPADGGTLPAIYVPPSGFVTVQGAGAVRRIRRPPVRSSDSLVRSTGFVDIPQGPAAARPETRLLLSSFADQELRANVQVSVADESGNGRSRETLLNQTITVPAGGGRELLLDNVEGRTIEVVVRTANPLIIPSLDISIHYLADDSTQSVLRLGPDDFIPVNLQS